MKKFISILFIFSIFYFINLTPTFAKSSVPPVMFRTWDYQNGDYGKLYPQYGPIGGIFIMFWDQVNAVQGKFDWGTLDAALDKAASMKTAPFPDGKTIPKPVIIQIDFWEEASRAGEDSIVYSDYTPSWVYDSAGSANMCINPSTGKPCASGESGRKTGYVFEVDPAKKKACGTGKYGIAPRVNDSKWQEAYFNLIKEMAKKYDNDSRVAGVIIGSGIGAEPFLKKDGWNCNNRSPFPENDFKKFIASLGNVARQSFKNKTAYYTAGGNDFTQDVVNAVMSGEPRLGLKSNALDVELNWYRYLDGQPQNTWPMSAFDGESKVDTSWAFEDAKFPGQSELYYMTLWAISGHADWIDWRDKPTLNDRWGAIYSLLPNFWTDFVPRYLGKQLSEASSVWIALRDSKNTDICWTDSQTQKKVCDKPRYGNFSYWLYQLDGITGGKTTPIWRANLPSSAQNQIYSAYSRRTDKASNNNYMYFKIDDNFSAKKQGQTGYKLKIIYLNSGSDNFLVEYKDKNGQQKSQSITKTNTGLFVEKLLDIPDLYLGNGMDGSTDFRINSGGASDLTAHMVILYTGGYTPPTQGPIPTINSTPTPIPTSAITPLSLTLSSGWNYLTWKSSWGTRTESELPSKCQFVSHFNNYSFDINIRSLSLNKTLVPGQIYFIYCQ